jgi:hypothetical protein
MKKRWQLALLLILLSSGISLLFGLEISRRSVPGGAVDFQIIYYGTKCVIHHHDPYRIDELRGIFASEAKRLPPGSIDPSRDVELFDNLPTIFVLVLPFVMLPWWLALTVWMTLLFGGSVLTSILMWKVGSEYAPVPALVLVCILLSNMQLGVALGNTGLLVISLSVMAVWCLLNQRFVPFATVCLAVCLISKPHDAGLIWLYFILSGGFRRKQALRSLAITVALSLIALLWISYVSPGWYQEWHANLSVMSEHGHLNDAGPDALHHGIVIDLQAAISVFWDNPTFYNTVAYLVCGTLLLLWSVTTLRYPFSKVRAWFALAAIVPITMLVTYHRLYDSKLLILTVPACAILCARGGRMGRTALVVNVAAFILTGDIPFALFQVIADRLHAGATGMHEKLLMLLLTRQVSLILLVMAMFYLWVYVRTKIGDESSVNSKEAIA